MRWDSPRRAEATSARTRTGLDVITAADDRVNACGAFDAFEGLALVVAWKWSYHGSESIVTAFAYIAMFLTIVCLTRLKLLTLTLLRLLLPLRGPSAGL